MHLLVLALLVSEVRGLDRFEGILVGGLQMKVSDDIGELAGLNVFILDLKHRLTDVPSAEGSLKVGVFNGEGELSCLLAFHGRPIETQYHILWLG